MHLISLSVDNSETFASLIKHVAIDVWCSTSANLNSLNNPQVYVIAHLKGTLMSPSQFSYIRVANYFLYLNYKSICDSSNPVTGGNPSPYERPLTNMGK